MNKNNALRPIIVFLAVLSVLVLILSCKEGSEDTLQTNEIAIAKPEVKKVKSPRSKLSQEFKTYWYSGQAEITSYKLQQARYGELRDGTAVLVYVTEDFLPETQVKADNYSEDNIPVLKLNATKNFNTGIYPYSIMQSTFYPVANNRHAIKISASVQEWCGQVYAQLNNRDTFEIMSHSYFQGEADQNLSIKKTWTENELWTKLRIDPKSLPTGSLSIIPSLEYTRLKHKAIKPYAASARLEEGKYTIVYNELNRSLVIDFNPEFPYDILGWEESIPLSYGESAMSITTKATKLETIKSAYWGQNSNADTHLRASLKLE